MSGQIRAALLPLCVCILLGAVGAPVNGAQLPRLSIAMKGPKGLMVPVTGPLKTALLVVTSSWQDIRALTDLRMAEASGQPLAMADLSVVLSTQSLDCSSVFNRAPSTAETDVTVIAGTAEAFLASRSWQTTWIGKIFMTPTSTLHLSLDRFNADVHTAALRRKQKTASKDGLGGAENWFVLDRERGAWRVDLAVSVGDARIVVKTPLTVCPIASRAKSDGQPLLTERRLLDAARRLETVRIPPVVEAVGEEP